MGIAVPVGVHLLRVLALRQASLLLHRHAAALAVGQIVLHRPHDVVAELALALLGEEVWLAVHLSGRGEVAAERPVLEHLLAQGMHVAGVSGRQLVHRTESFAAFQRAYPARVISAVVGGCCDVRTEVEWMRTSMLRAEASENRLVVGEVDALIAEPALMLFAEVVTRWVGVTAAPADR